MTVLANARNTAKRGSFPVSEYFVVPVAASTKIYQGALVAINAAGNAVAGTTVASGRVLGRARALADNSAGGAGAINVEVERGVFRFDNSTSTDAITAADVGRPCYAVDDATVARDSSMGARSIAGTVVDVDSAGVWVQTFSVNATPSVDLPFIAGADLSSSGNVILKVNNSGQVVVAGAGEMGVGVLQNAPTNGALAIVRVAGITACKADGTGVTRGDRISSAANGLGRATLAAGSGTGVVDTSDAGSATDPLKGAHVLGVALTTAVASAQFQLLLTHSGAVPTTNV